MGAVTIASSLFSEPDPIPKVGNPAPSFKLAGLDGEPHRLSEFVGQPLVINFWGSFCDPCVEEMPMIEQYYQDYKDEGLIVLGLNLNEPKVTVKSFVRETGVSFPILLDDDTVRKKYGVKSYPTTFFIDENGVIQDIYIGYMNETVFKYRVYRLLDIEI